jgi:hypothetical protein
MTEMHKQALDAEIASLLAHGMEQVTVKDFYGRYDAAGFRFDHSCTIRAYGRYLTGPRAGQLSPDMNLYPVHKETGLSAFHFQLPRAEYEKVKALRNSIFAVNHGYIMGV